MIVGEPPTGADGHASGRASASTPCGPCVSPAIEPPPTCSHHAAAAALFPPLDGAVAPAVGALL